LFLPNQSRASGNGACDALDATGKERASARAASQLVSDSSRAPLVGSSARAREAVLRTPAGCFLATARVRVGGKLLLNTLSAYARPPAGRAVFERLPAPLLPAARRRMVRHGVLHRRGNMPIAKAGGTLRERARRALARMHRWAASKKAVPDRGL